MRYRRDVRLKRATFLPFFDIRISDFPTPLARDHEYTVHREGGMGEGFSAPLPVCLLTPNS